jgi:hypothetical protein
MVSSTFITNIAVLDYQSWTCYFRKGVEVQDYWEDQDQSVKLWIEQHWTIDLSDATYMFGLMLRFKYKNFESKSGSAYDMII